MNKKRLVLHAAAAGLYIMIAGCGAPAKQVHPDDTTQEPYHVLQTANTDSSAAIVLDEHSGLNDYLAYAALHNPGLEAAFNRWQAALEKIPQAQALPDPRLTYSYYIETVETRVGPQRHRFDISQTFPWFGIRELRGDIAHDEADALQETFEAMKRTLFLSVKRSYFEYYYLSRAIKLNDENLKLLGTMENIARTGYSSGNVQYQDVIKFQVEIGKLEERLLSLRDMIVPVTAELNAALNRPVYETLPAPESIPDSLAVPTDDSLLSHLSQDNPELKALDFRIHEEEKSIDLARKQLYPDITLGVNYIETGKAVMPGVKNSGKDPVMGMFTVNLPIWRGKYHAAVREAQARQKSAVQIRNARENSLDADLKRALFDFRDSERKIDLYKNTLIPKANESLEVSLRAFEAGKSDFLNLIDSQRTLLEFELSYERAKSDRARAFAEIEFLAGENPSDNRR
ncbi:TolC family protein [bacterium]|nr:TolC family protein [bacterium]